jgi:DNA-binding response OmpR family regulator
VQYDGSAVQTVLVVEDDEGLRGLLRRALILAGFDVIEAGDGLHALQVLDRHPPAVILLDLGLPIVSGEFVRQEIADHAHTRDIPIVVITGRPGDHQELDVACVLKKPVDPDNVVAIVQRCLAEGTAIKS